MSSIKDFSHHLSFVYLNQSLAWAIEYTLDEEDLGIIIDGIAYEADGEQAKER